VVFSFTVIYSLACFEKLQYLDFTTFLDLHSTLPLMDNRAENAQSADQHHPKPLPLLMFTAPLRRLSLQSKHLPGPTPARMVSASPTTNVRAPSVPRPSASLIVVNDNNEILLVQRNPKSRSFAGAHVFPGGNYDEDDGSHRVTAIRETFEETGLLVAKSRLVPAASGERPTAPTLDQDALDRARRSILLGQTMFSKFLNEAGLTPAVDELLPFTEWITPVQAPRCGFCGDLCPALNDRSCG